MPYRRDDKGVHLLQQVVDDTDFIRNLCAAQDGNQRTLWIVERLTHDRDFLLNQITADSW